MEPGMMNTSAAGGGEALGMLFMLMMAAVYFYLSFALMTMAKKLDQADIAWWAWIPIMNTLLMIKMAEKPGTWFLLLLLPIVNIVVFAMLWMEIARKLGKSTAHGFMMLIPGVNFISAGILAFGADSGLRRVKPQAETTRHTPQNVG